MVPLNFNCPVDHFVDGLVDDDGSMGLTHDFVYLVATSADEEGNHAFRDENYDGKGLSFYFFEGLVDVSQHSLAAEVLMFDFFIKNLVYGSCT